MSIINSDDNCFYKVLINEDDQYSLWPKDKKVPQGWKNVGKQGLKQECLDFMNAVWIKPTSIRRQEEIISS